MTDTPLPLRGPVPERRANLFSTMIDAMGDGMMVVDHKLRVVVTNRSLRDTLVLPPSNHGKPLASLMAEPRLVEAFAQVLAGDGPRTVEVEHRGLQTRVLQVKVVPLPDHEYWGHRALGVVHDVTERRAVERMLMDFIANASHELRTPTTAILGWAETLAESPPKDPQKLAQVHQTIYRHADRLSTLLNQLLDLCRLDQTQWQLDLAPLPVASVLDALVETQTEAAQQAGLSLRATVADDLPAVLADRMALETVLGNLLQNAIKYTPTGGRVEVRAALNGPQPSAGIRFSVIDSGVGIPQEDQARVFERFYRVDKGRTRQVGGAGLGLSIVQSLVQQLGGKLELSSQMGKGSTFSVILPAAKP